MMIYPQGYHSLPITDDSCMLVGGLRVSLKLLFGKQK